jgi:hypothetical protein
MQFGVQLAGGAAVCSRDALRRVGAVAEELGYDSILIGEEL